MASKALSKKTLGIENENYLSLSFIFTYLLSVVLIVLSCIEFILLVPLNNAEEGIALIINILHSIGFAALLLPLSLTYCKWSEAELQVTTYSALIPVAHFFIVVLYMYNPRIIEYRNKAYFKIQSIASLLFYVIFTFPSTWILWRMSKVKPDYDGDEPYLVIYGGEESVTKKLPDDSD